MINDPEFLAPAIWQYPGHGPHAAYTLWNKHADFYFNSDFLVRNPAHLRLAAQALFNAIRGQLNEKPDWIVTYPPYGMNISFCLAELLGCKFGYIKSLDSPELNFDIRSTESVLFCADDLHTGNSFRKVRAAVESRHARIVQPLAVIGNFCGDLRFDGFDVASLFQKTINIWDATECPLCEKGSEAVLARQNWSVFAP